MANEFIVSSGVIRRSHSVELSSVKLIRNDVEFDIQDNAEETVASES